MIKSKKLKKIKNIKHGFFNSIGGKSKNIYKSLNCGPSSKDIPTNVQENLKIVKNKIDKLYIDNRSSYVCKKCQFLVN